ncbi:MAG TPA: nucleotidyltransferase substrate binding protein [Myxococcota bacterium]|nr:nucleotidyltransferase substrate binding protein [Myxococcota bacterium]
MALDLEGLEKTVASLRDAVAVAGDEQFMASLDEVKRDVIRAGVIQNFEFTYELGCKFIKRWLALNAGPEAADPLTRRDLFRLAARHGLIDDPPKWFEYADARNITSHTYNRQTAERVYRLAIEFSRDVQLLLAKLKSHDD